MGQTDSSWDVLQRETIYDSNWVGLQLLDLRLPDGKVLHDIHFLDFKQPAAGVIPVGRDGRVLMVDHYRFQTGTRGWEIPAGRIEPGESPEQAIFRELREETGHGAESLCLLGRYFPSQGSSNQCFHVFIARGVEQSGEIEDKNEVIGLRWFSTQELQDLIRQNGIVNGLALTALCWGFLLGEI